MECLHLTFVYTDDRFPRRVTCKTTLERGFFGLRTFENGGEVEIENLNWMIPFYGLNRCCYNGFQRAGGFRVTLYVGIDQVPCRNHFQTFCTLSIHWTQHHHGLPSESYHWWEQEIEYYGYQIVNHLNTVPFKTFCNYAMRAMGGFSHTIGMRDSFGKLLKNSSVYGVVNVPSRADTPVLKRCQMKLCLNVLCGHPFTEMEKLTNRSNVV